MPNNKAELEGNVSSRYWNDKMKVNTINQPTNKNPSKNENKNKTLDIVGSVILKTTTTTKKFNCYVQKEMTYFD